MASRRATVADLRELAGSMPGATVERGPKGNDVYQVSRRSFVFFRTPRPDAVDPDSGERYDDVVVLWVESEVDKLALVADESTPFFTTPHFDGHPSVLLRTSRIGELDRDELAEVVYDAWLARASKTAARKWLESQRPPSAREPDDP
ncbi:MAG: MmcQ/YjbR family DNA-binding protein [Nocardioides sp.]